MILTCRKIGQKQIRQYSVDGLDDIQVLDKLKSNNFDEKLIMKPVDYYDKPWIFKSKKLQRMKNKIAKKKPIYFDNKQYFDVKGGFQPPISESELFEIDQKEYDQLNKNEKTKCHRLIFDSNEISRYIISKIEANYWILLNDVDDLQVVRKDFPNLYNILRARIINKTGKWWHFPNVRNFTLIKETEQKLLSPRTADVPTFAYDDQKSVFKGTNTMIISKVFSHYYILGILNSSLSDFWYSNYGYDYHGAKTKKYEPAKAKAYLLPIKKTTTRNTEKLIKLVKDIIEKNSELLGTRKMTDKYNELIEGVEQIQININALVFFIYGLSVKDIEFINLNMER